MSNLLKKSKVYLRSAKETIIDYTKDLYYKSKEL